MAKKQETILDKAKHAFGLEKETVAKQPETSVETQTLPKKEKWVIKNRTYLLDGNKKPLSKMIKSAGIYYFDEELGYERELKYCENQRSCFVDEMQGDQRLSHIIFRNGALVVPKNKVTLQKLLSLYHPHKDIVYSEWKPQIIAQDELTDINLEVDALIAARNMDIDMAEAVMRVELGSKVSKMSSKELKRDLLVFAKKNPRLLLELASDTDSLSTIRNSLRQVLLQSPMCDGRLFAKHFMLAMRAIWQRYCEDKAPAALTFNPESVKPAPTLSLSPPASTF